MSKPVSDEELLAALASELGTAAELIYRRPYRYATSAPLEQVRVRARDGSDAELILKDLARERLLGDARKSKPEYIWEPRRELETYRRILTPPGIGPRCLAAIGGPHPWMVIEKVPGVELWQIGELGVWRRVAAWLGRLHASFAGREEELRSVNPHLLALDGAWLMSWYERARRALASSSDGRAQELVEALTGYESWARELDGLPRTFLHGEFYPSNVIVVQGADPIRVCPVDWEMAGIGPGVVDLAALVGGWDAENRDRLVSAYRAGLAAGAERRDTTVTERSLALARLHYALQWLGWSADWRPPREHAHDWLGEALDLVRGRELAEGATGR
jgi:aminoglycoside phosphotransferase (APT) family kinase protein